MIQYLYLIFLLSFSVVLEVLFRSVGLYMPFAAFAVFYAASLCGVVPGIGFGLVAGFLLDSLLGYEYPVSMLLFLLILPISWLVREDFLRPNSLLIQMGIGSLFVVLVQLPVIPLIGSWHVTLELLPNLFLASLFSALLLPFFIMVADRIASLLNLRTYAGWLQVKRNRN